jgi:ribosome-binding ATPase YchF (GTP1/OBG family)
MPQTVSLYDALLDLIRISETIDDARKEQLISAIKHDGLNPELMQDVNNLLQNELNSLDQDISEKQELVQALENAARREKEDIAPAVAFVEEDYAKAAGQIADDFTQFCDKEERTVDKDVETHTKKGEVSEMDAIRSFLQKK